MRIKPQTIIRGVWVLILIAVFGALAYPSRLSAQAVKAEDIYNEAQKSVNEGNVGNASLALDELLTKYKASPIIPNARYLLAFCYVLQGQYQGAATALDELLKTPNLDPVLQEQGSVLLAQCYAGITSQKENPAEKKEFFEKAAKQYTDFLTKFPKSIFREDALNGRALTYFFLEKYDDAVKQKKKVLKEFPNSKGRLDAVYLLGLVKATQAVVADQAKKTDEANAKFAEATKLFQEVVTNGSDIPLKNEALFQVAEILFNKGDYDLALNNFRQILPKSEVIKLQQQKIGEIMVELRGSVGDPVKFKAIQKYLSNERMKLGQMESKSDQYVDAALKSATIYNLQQKPDESRIIIKQFLPFLKASQVQNAQYQLVISYSQQGLMPQAEKAKTDFFSQFPKAPEGDQFGLVFGYAYLNQGLYDKAAGAFKDSLDMYGEKHRSFAEMLAGQAMVYRTQGKLKEASDVFRDFLAKNQDSPMAESVMFQLATTEMEMKEYDNSIKTYRDYLVKYPNGAYRLDSQLQIARTLLEKSPSDPKVGDEAIKELQDLLSKNPPAKTGSLALYFIGQTYEKQGKLDDAVKAYRDNMVKYPDERTSLISAYQIAIGYQKAKKYPEMIAAYEELIKKYPESDMAPQAYLAIARQLENEKKHDEARAKYTEIVEKYKDKPVGADAQERIFFTFFDKAQSMGRPISMTPDQKEQYKKLINDAIASAERLLELFPDSLRTGDALTNMMKAKQTLASGKMDEGVTVDAYLGQLADKASAKSNLKAQILFTQAGILQQEGKQKEALVVFDKILAETPDAKLSADNLDRYGRALVATGKTDEALKVYERIMTDFANSPRSMDKGVFGLGLVYYNKGEYVLADKQFNEMKTNYRWSPLMGDAIYYSGMTQLKGNKFDEAIKIFESVAGSKGSSNESKGRALIGAGDAELGKKDYNKALGNYIKVTLFYEGLTDVASEATLKSAQMNEKLGKGEEAKKLYQQLKTKYPDSAAAKQAP